MCKSRLRFQSKRRRLTQVPVGSASPTTACMRGHQCLNRAIVGDYDSRVPHEEPQVGGIMWKAGLCVCDQDHIQLSRWFGIIEPEARC
jgi:hypothetical protein